MNVYGRGKIDSSLTSVIVRFLAQLIRTIGLATKLMSEGRMSEFISVVWVHPHHLSCSQNNFSKLLWGTKIKSVMR